MNGSVKCVLSEPVVCGDGSAKKDSMYSTSGRLNDRDF